MKSDYIKASAYNALYKYMQYENVLVLRLCLETGMRVGDAVALKKTALKGRSIFFTSQKTGKPCKKVLSQKLVNELKRNSCGDWFFPGRCGGHRKRQTVWKDVKKAAALAKLPEHVSPHSTRKTYAVKIFHEDGINAAAEALQHDKLETTMLYVFSDLLNETNRNAPALCQTDVNGVSESNLYNLIKKAVTEALAEFLGNSGLTFSSL